jgi:hypothetical protein
VGYWFFCGTLELFWQCHYLVFYWTLELFRQCGIIVFFYWALEVFRQCDIIWFSIGLWNCSNSVALFVFIWDFGTVPTV